MQKSYFNLKSRQLLKLPRFPFKQKNQYEEAAWMKFLDCHNEKTMASNDGTKKIYRCVDKFIGLSIDYLKDQCKQRNCC